MLDIVGIATRPPIEVTPFFNLVMVWNHGVSFGMFSGTDNNYMPIALIAVACTISVFLLGWLWRGERIRETLAIALVIGGAMGNVVDRIRFGAVADFVDIHVAGYHWPAFNVADSAIFLGVAWLLYDGIVNKPSNS